MAALYRACESAEHAALADGIDTLAGTPAAHVRRRSARDIVINSRRVPSDSLLRASPEREDP